MTDKYGKTIFEPCLYDSKVFDSLFPSLRRPANTSIHSEVSTVFSGSTDDGEERVEIDDTLRSTIAGYLGMTVRTLPSDSENENGRFLVEFRFQHPISTMWLLGVIDTCGDLDLYYTLRACTIDGNSMETVVSRLTPKEGLEDPPQSRDCGFNGKLIWSDSWTKAQAVLANFQTIHADDEADIYVKPYANEAGLSGLHFTAAIGNRSASVKGANNSDQLVVLLGFKHEDFDICGTPQPSVRVVCFNKNEAYEAAQHLHTWLIETPSSQRPLHLPPTT